MFVLFLAYIFTLYIRPQDWHPAFLGMPIDVYIFAAILILLLATGRAALRLTAAHWMLLLLAAWVYLGGLVNSDFEIANEWGYKYFRFFVIFFCCVASLDTVSRIRRALWFMIILAATLGVQNIDMVLSGVGWAGQGFGWVDTYTLNANELGRAKWVGLWDGMNVMCLLFLATLPVAIHFFAESRSWTRLFAAAMLALSFAGTYLTKSRGGLATFALIFALTLLYRYARTSFAVKVKIFAIIMVLFTAFMAISPARMFIIKDEEKSAQYRVDMWMKGFDMVLNNPVTGVGRGNFQSNSGFLIAHNSFIEMAAETGVVGVMIWTSLIFLILRNLYYASRLSADPDLKALSSGVFFSIIGYLIASVFITAEFELFYLLLGIGYSVAALSGVKKEFGLDVFAKAAAFDFAVGAVFYAVTVLYWRFG